MIAVRPILFAVIAAFSDDPIQVPFGQEPVELRPHFSCQGRKRKGQRLYLAIWIRLLTHWQDTQLPGQA